MKQTLHYCLISFLTLTLGLSVACNDRAEEEYEETYVRIESIQEGQAVLLPASSGNFDVDVLSNTEWRVACGETWLRFVPESQSGDGRIEFTYDRNDGDEERSAEVTVSGGDDVVTFSVVQSVPSGEEGGGDGDGEPQLLLLETFGRATTDRSVGNHDDWSKEGTGATGVFYSYDGVTSKPVRETVPSERYPDASGQANLYTASGGEFTVSGIALNGSRTLTLSIGTNIATDELDVSYAFGTDAQSWHTATPVSEKEGGSWGLAEYAAFDCLGESIVSLRFVFRTTGRLDDIRLTGDGGEGSTPTAILRAEIGSLNNLPPEGVAMGMFALAASVPWTATADQWITLSPLSGSGSVTIEYSILPNDGEKARTGTITFSCTDGSVPPVIIPVSQLAEEESGGPVLPGVPSGWAELPAVIENGDYHYAYHMRADKETVRNFSVCYSASKICPVWVAAPMHSSYKGSSGRTNAYGRDPDISCTQAGRWDGYTRGHMLGSSDRTVSKATNRQVFYYSNIAPQLSAGFNTGGGVWNNLEEFVDDLWCADTLYQVIGCYWENENKKVDGTVIPTHYYKVLLRTKAGNTGKWVVNCTSDQLQCVAFIVEHNSKQFQVKPNRSMMMSVSELERMTGLTYFVNVPAAPKSTYDPADWGL